MPHRALCRSWRGRGRCRGNPAQIAACPGADLPPCDLAADVVLGTVGVQRRRRGGRAPVNNSALLACRRASRRSSVVKPVRRRKMRSNRVRSARRRLFRGWFGKPSDRHRSSRSACAHAAGQHGSKSVKASSLCTSRSACTQHNACRPTANCPASSLGPGIAEEVVRVDAAP